ncbi:(2Fe-2S)-binding protein [Yinghuangia seranimata]|uniref:(2Fe-2S)-binding protein n=1 Tax=Yinghuangia seranimata TaxID=408067 RepID=UPI00248BF59A|nr:(2Fe-2S)-binding protein [Yinghuangia seranimata]MDI2127876.1 (2Fe-2S)-binding protein [Yinghuangia seranimata]
MTGSTSPDAAASDQPQPADPDLTQALDAVSAVNPFFAVATSTQPPAGAPFQPFTTVYAGAAGAAVEHETAAKPKATEADADDHPLTAATQRLAERLHTPEPRVAASLLHLGLAARLWSVALGAAVLGGVVPDLDPARTYWRMPGPGPVELWLPNARPLGKAARPGDVPHLTDLLHEAVAVRNLTPLNRAIRTVSPLAEGLLWGNAASALTGTARMLHQWCGADRPDEARTAVATAELLLATPELQGTGTWEASPPDGFRRTSCCLYYRTPEGGTCGDCVFGDHPPRSA